MKTSILMSVLYGNLLHQKKKKKHFPDVQAPFDLNSQQMWQTVTFICIQKKNHKHSKAFPTECPAVSPVYMLVL